MFLKKEQMKPTHLTQQTSTVYCLAPWAWLYRGEAVVTMELNYSQLHLSRFVITVFRTYQYQFVYCARSLQSAQNCTV